MSLAGKKILIGLSGGISAYKVCGWVSTWVQEGAQVQVAMTEMATRFVGPLTFEALTGRRVIVEIEGQGSNAMEHIEAARWADVYVIAPATANRLAKQALGLADDILSTLGLSCPCPQVIVPAMNPTMWSKASVLRNVEQIRKDGCMVIEPDAGRTACGDEGVGRLPEELVVKEVLLKRLS